MFSANFGVDSGRCRWIFVICDVFALGITPGGIASQGLQWGGAVKRLSQHGGMRCREEDRRRGTTKVIRFYGKYKKKMNVLSL